MSEFFAFFGALWQDWISQSPVNRAAIAGTFLLPLLGWLWTTLRVRDKAARIGRLQQENSALQQDCKDAQARADLESAFASQWMPERWLETAARERRDGNEEKAVEALRIGFENVAPALAQAAGDLAGHNLSLMAERDPAAALEAAARFARIAALLDPSDRDAARLMEEVVQARSDLGEAVTDEDLIHAPLPSDPEEAARLIGAIRQRGGQLFQAGRYRLARRLFTRGVLAARRASLFDQEPGFLVRYAEAQAEGFAGDAADALEKVQQLLLVQRHVQGVDHPDVLAALYLEALLVSEAGDTAGALEKLKSLLPIRERVQGPEHPAVLSTRYLQAYLLSDTGDVAGALEKVRLLLPVEESVRGVGHPDVLTTRYLEAYLMSETGDVNGALEKVRLLLPIEERVRGRGHPDVLRTRWLHAKIQAEQGEVEAALTKWREILPFQEVEMLPTHRYVRDTREMIAKYSGEPSPEA